MLEIKSDFLRQFESLVDQAKKILLFSHKAPDGDTLGSTTGLYDVLTRRGKICDIICVDKPSDQLAFLPNAGIIKHDFNVEDYDLVIICDIAAVHLMGLDNPDKVLKPSSGVPVLNIDHHGSNENFADINYVDTHAASTTTIIASMLMKLNWKISPDAATSFLTGIYTDTGSFMHSNTNPVTLRTAARLISMGANIRKIRKHVFKTTKISTLRLWGRVLQSIYKNDEGVTVSVVTDNDFRETGAHHSDLTGVVDYVNSVPDSNFSMLLTEKDDGVVKGSLRTLKNDVDLSEIAGRFGGGGHKKAAGFTVKGKLQKEVRWTVVN